MKFTNKELNRIDAYRAKCAENVVKAGGSVAEMMRAYIYSERKAFQVVLSDTRPGLKGWWNTEQVEQEVRDDVCAGCKKEPEKVETIVEVDGEWICNECIEKRGYLYEDEGKPSEPYGEAVSFR